MRDGMAMRRSSFLLALLLPLAGCTTPSPPPKPAAPPPMPPPTPAPTVPEDWRDRPETPGGWAYDRAADATSARFGLAGAPVFLVRCELASHRVFLTRYGAAAATMRIETSYSAATWPAQATPEGATVTLEARDPFLDKMAFSRGRFTVSIDGQPELVLPAWAEPARVLEDCRT
jgi:hypothetical protein